MSTTSLQFTLTSAAIAAALNLGSVNLNVGYVQLGNGNASPLPSQPALVSPQEYASISSYTTIAVGQNRLVSDIVGSSSSYTVSEVGIWSGIPGSSIVASGVAGNTFLTASSAVTLAAGTPVIGTGIPAGTIVSSAVTSSTNIPISSALSATETGQTYSTCLLVFYWSQASGYVAVKSASVDFIFETDMFFGGVVPSNISIVVDTSGAAGMIGVHNADPNAHSGILRKRLTANTTFYVSPTGSDTAGNGSSATPWATIQHAWSVFKSSYDFAGYSVTLQLANGTYAPANFNGSILGCNTDNPLIVNGNSGSPSSTVIDATAAGSACVYLSMGAIALFQNILTKSSTSLAVACLYSDFLPCAMLDLVCNLVR